MKKKKPKQTAAPESLAKSCEAALPFTCGVRRSLGSSEQKCILLRGVNTFLFISFEGFLAFKSYKHAVV